MLCWVPTVTELPPVVRGVARAIHPAGVMLYPYWLTDVRVAVKSPLLPRVSRRYQAAVDAVSGVVTLLPAAVPIRDYAEGELVDAQAVPIVIARDEIDPGQLQRALLPHVARKFRAAMTATLEIGTSRVIYKQLLLFTVEFTNGIIARLALDTLTGEYGVVPIGATPISSRVESSR